jgi:hypothetical protein
LGVVEGNIRNCFGKLNDPGKPALRRLGILPQQLRTSPLFARRFTEVVLNEQSLPVAWSHDGFVFLGRERTQFRMVEDDKKVSPEKNRPGSGTSVRFLTSIFFGESENPVGARQLVRNHEASSGSSPGPVAWAS